MENIILMIGVLLVFLFGYIVMKRLDYFLYENEKERERDVKIKEPTSVKLSGDLPLMEIDKEIDKFKKIHPDFEIILRREKGDDEEE